MLVGGLFVFLSGYSVYAFFLGGIDGLPPLPLEYAPRTGPAEKIEIIVGLREKMIEQAFGPDCEELRRHIRLLVKDKGMILSAGQFSIETDGRVKFEPFSAALFSKTKEGEYPEINTVKCDFAFLTLDKPVQVPSELANRKVMAVELRSIRDKVKLTNNRRTPAKNDDVEVEIAMRPLYYEDRTNLIRTDGYVHLKDFQSQPRPTEIKALGMELHLSPDSSPNKPRVAKTPTQPKGEGVNSVELIVLRQTVEMHLWVDTNDGFLGREETPPGAKPVGKAEAPPPKSQVFIKTPGPFTYDLTKELAWFDSPPVLKGGVLPASPQRVLVSRWHPESKTDQIDCDHLKLQFRKKAVSPGAKKNVAPADSPTGDKEIEWAIATSRPGQQVTLAMDTQGLEAYGYEMHYYAEEPGRGPKTIVKGSPMRAVKDFHKIRARELHLTANDKDGKGQAAYAKGPGVIDLADKSAKPNYPTHITWKDTLVSVQERDGDKLYEKWTMTEDAVYVDEEQKQELRGQVIQLWLEPNDPARGGPKSSGGPKQRLHKVEAFERVFAMAQETTIKRADHLLMVFRPEVAAGAVLPSVPEPPAPTATPVIGPADAKDAKSAPANGDVKPGVRPSDPSDKTPVIGPPHPAGPDKGKPAEPKEPARKPILLEAKDVVIYMATQGGSKQLDWLDASGQVHVVQEAEKAGDKGTDIRGDLLNLKRLGKENENVLTVFGANKDNPARLEMGETILFGPKVTIDQLKNHADVEGAGSMSMPSKTTLEGDRPARPGARMDIFWQQNMTFDGKVAFFVGGVQGFQDESRLKCESMQATMDRLIVFKQGQTSNEGAKVERLLCNAKVYGEDEQRDRDGRRTQASRLWCTQLDVHNNEATTSWASGPGRVDHLGYSDADTGPQANGPQANGPQAAAPGINPIAVGGNAPPRKPREMKLTRIDYKGRMFSSTKNNLKKAKFYDEVEVFNVPSEVFDVPLVPDKLPPGGFFLTCDRLDLEAHEDKDKTTQRMIAWDHVTFRNPDCFGRCDVLKFDEANDTIIFEAKPGNLVRMVQRTPGGGQRDITGEQVLYNRKLGTFRANKIGSINSSWLEVPSIPITGLNAYRQDQPLLRLGLAARDDRQELAAHRAIDNLALVRRKDRQPDLVVLVGRLLDRDLGGLAVDEREFRLLTGRQRS
jgi:hypothetical protein